MANATIACNKTGDCALGFALPQATGRLFFRASPRKSAGIFARWRLIANCSAVAEDMGMIHFEFGWSLVTEIDIGFLFTVLFYVSLYSF